MPDFGPRWINPEKLDAGGQAQTFTVDDADNPDGPKRVAKVLNNPKEDRRTRFLQEIEVTQGFDHPNVVRSLARGETPKSKFPFFVMPYYALGTLETNIARLGSPIDRLNLFISICQGVEYAHGKKLIHRDLKPANIFMEKPGVPIVGDFGLCYRAENDKDDRNTQTAEAVGARKFMPPEWREGRVEDPQATGDIYSLGKILYYIFEGRVYDGNEDDHTVDHPLVAKSDVLQNQIPQPPQRWIMARWLVDELVGSTVRKKPTDRLESVATLTKKVQAAIDRIESDGRVLDLNLPKRCLFCAAGTYQYPVNIPFLSREVRRNPPQLPPSQSWHFKSLQESIKGQLGFGAITPGPIPMFLVCNVCGNVQYFRLDLTDDKSGQKWNL